MTKSKKWIQKAVKKSHEGYCTPMSKSTCTPARKKLAKRFKKGGDLYSGKTKNESTMPSLESLEILAISDKPNFERMLPKFGLKIEGKRDTNPLRSQVQEESVASIASELTEDYDTNIEINEKTAVAKSIAENYGYIVSYT